jgi:tryptophan synthase alpha chain
MNNRIRTLFASGKKDILAVYFTAGFPELDHTVKIIQALEKAGADLVEIGMPFSDPLADGPVIQQSSKRALDKGMTMKLLFDQLKDIRSKVSIPLVLMGYLNPVLQFGVEKFCAGASAAGIDGLILPDLPVSEYLSEYKQVFERYDLLNMFLITPQTSEERIRYIDENSSGFIYVVSSASTTGSMKQEGEEQEKYFRRIRHMQLKSPAMIGFGISDSQAYRKACTYADGAIIGSAFIKAIANSADIENDIHRFIKSIKAN